MIILCQRRRAVAREKGLRREDILHAVPLVCVMVLKGCILVLLTVMVVGVELNSPCQAAPVTYWAIKEKHSTHSSSYTAILRHVTPARAFVLLY